MAQTIIVRLGGGRFKLAQELVEEDGIKLYGFVGKSRRTLAEAVTDLMNTGAGVSAKEVAAEIKRARQEALTKTETKPEVKPEAKPEVKGDTAPKPEGKKK
jgi:hypothetical protein